MQYAYVIKIIGIMQYAYIKTTPNGIVCHEKNGSVYKKCNTQPHHTTLSIPLPYNMPSRVIDMNGIFTQSIHHPHQGKHIKKPWHNH